MPQNIDYDLFTAQLPQRVGESAKNTRRAPAPAAAEVPRLITKKWLYNYYDLSRPGGRCRCDQLYKKVLTPSVLSQIGRTEEDVRQRSVKYFDAVTSRHLCRILGIE